MQAETLLRQCPLCASKRQRYAFYRAERRYVECTDCNLIFLNPGEATGASGTGEPPGVMREKAQYFLSQLLRYRGEQGGTMLAVCETGSAFHEESSAAGYRVNVVTPAELATGVVPDGVYDVCIFWHTLGRISDPLAALRAAHAELSEGAIIGVITPDMNSLPARILCEDWPAFKTLQTTVFNRQALETALFFANFNEVIVSRSQRLLNIEQMANYSAGRRGWRPSLCGLPIVSRSVRSGR